MRKPRDPYMSLCYTTHVAVSEWVWDKKHKNWGWFSLLCQFPLCQKLRKIEHVNRFKWMFCKVVDHENIRECSQLRQCFALDERSRTPDPTSKTCWGTLQPLVTICRLIFGCFRSCSFMFVLTCFLDFEKVSYSHITCLFKTCLFNSWHEAGGS